MQIKEEVKVKSKQVPKEARQHSDICPMRKGMWLYKTVVRKYFREKNN